MSARCESTPRPGTHDSSLFAPGSAVVSARPASPSPRSVDALPSGIDQTAVDDLRAFGNVDDEDAGVVHDRAIARTDLERLGEAILGERHRRVEHLHAELAFRGNR